MPPIAVLVALADPTRCRIIEILQRGPQPVHTLAGAFDISRPAISRHLRVLKQARLISEKKVGRENRYALHANRLAPVRSWLEMLQQTTAPEARSAAKALTARPKPAPVAKQQPTPARQPASPQPATQMTTAQMGFDF